MILGFIKAYLPMKHTLRLLGMRQPLRTRPSVFIHVMAVKACSERLPHPTTIACGMFHGLAPMYPSMTASVCEYGLPDEMETFAPRAWLRNTQSPQTTTSRSLRLGVRYYDLKCSERLVS